MCIGMPLQVLDADEASALCGDGQHTRRVGILLVGAVQPGEWLMVHVDQAVARLSADDARLIRDALAGAAAAANGEPWEHLFADLVDREPELPEHLRRGT